MNIGIFTDTFDPQINGVVTSIQSSIDYLKKQHNLVVFCPNVTPKVGSTPAVWRFSSILYPFQSEYRLALPFQSKQSKIKDLNLDIMHVHTPFSMGRMGLKLGRKWGIPVVHTYHTVFEKYLHYVPFLPKAMAYRYAKRASRKFCNACNKIIVPSHQMKQLLDDYHISRDIEIIPSGVNCYKPSESEQLLFKKKFMHEKKINALYVGRLGLEKNIYFLIDAFRQMIQKQPNLYLTIIGDGPERQRLQKKIDAYSLGEHITCTGYLQKKDVFAAYSAADLMLFPSTTETQGLTAVESIMSGTPVIGINKMGIKDVVIDQYSGILTEEDIYAYANAALSLVNDPEKRSVYSENAKKDGANYTHQKSGLKLEKLYLDVCKQYKQSI